MTPGSHRARLQDVVVVEVEVSRAGPARCARARSPFSRPPRPMTSRSTPAEASARPSSPSISVIVTPPAGTFFQVTFLTDVRTRRGRSRRAVGRGSSSSSRSQQDVAGHDLQARPRAWPTAGTGAQGVRGCDDARPCHPNRSSRASRSCARRCARSRSRARRGSSLELPVSAQDLRPSSLGFARRERCRCSSARRVCRRHQAGEAWIWSGASFLCQRIFPLNRRRRSSSSPVSARSSRCGCRRAVGELVKAHEVVAPGFVFLRQPERPPGFPAAGIRSVRSTIMRPIVELSRFSLPWMAITRVLVNDRTHAQAADGHLEAPDRISGANVDAHEMPAGEAGVEDATTVLEVGHDGKRERPVLRGAAGCRQLQTDTPVFLSNAKKRSRAGPSLPHAAVAE